MKKLFLFVLLFSVSGWFVPALLTQPVKAALPAQEGPAKEAPPIPYFTQIGVPWLTPCGWGAVLSDDGKECVFTITFPANYNSVMCTKLPAEANGTQVIQCRWKPSLEWTPKKEAKP